MNRNTPKKTRAGVPGNSANASTATYLIAKRMERAGMLRPGQALVLAATLPKVKRGARK